MTARPGGPAVMPVSTALLLEHALSREFSADAVADVEGLRPDTASASSSRVLSIHSDHSSSRDV